MIATVICYMKPAFHHCHVQLSGLNSTTIGVGDCSRETLANELH